MEEAQSGQGWLAGEGVASLLSGARVARMAVAGRRGPMISSQLFAAAEGRLWMISSRNSVRVRVIRRRPQVSVILRSGRRSAVVCGEAEILAPWGPVEALRLAFAAPAAAHALLGYATRNSTRMIGYLTDMLRIPPPMEALPFDRVLIAVTPERGFVWSGVAVTDVLGEWPGSPDDDAAIHIEALPVPPLAFRTGLPAGIPPWVGSVLDGRQACTLGWEIPDAALALPATWDPAGWRAELPAAVAAMVTPGARVARACIAVDRSVALRPTSYTGVLLRGTGRIDAHPAGGPFRVAVATERVSWWSGFTTGTVEVEERAVRRGRRSPARPVRPSRARRIS